MSAYRSLEIGLHHHFPTTGGRGLVGQKLYIRRHAPDAITILYHRRWLKDTTSYYYCRVPTSPQATDSSSWSAESSNNSRYISRLARHYSDNRICLSSSQVVLFWYHAAVTKSVSKRPHPKLRLFPRDRCGVEGLSPIV